MATDRLSTRIRRDEWPLVVLMFLYFFGVITTFWILKPIKKGLFVGFYSQLGESFELFGWEMSGPQAELIAKIGNLMVVFVAVVVFTWLARSLRRQQLTYVFGGFAFLVLVLYSLALRGAGEASIWSFYIFGDLYNSLMVATFFAFLNDSVRPDDARRLYGPIILGGVVGGAFGSIFVRSEIDHFAPATWVLICAGITVGVVLVAGAAGRLVTRRGEPAAEAPFQAPPSKPVSPALEGARLVFRSRYLLAIFALVGLYEIVSTLLDYQFTATVVHYVSGDPTKHFSTVYVITNVVALVVQLFLTANIMSRFGVKAALLVMPSLILGASGIFLLLPVLWIGSSLNTVDNALNYSINQSAREALYTPLSRDEKYKAKAFIDMFLYRTAKVVAVGVALAAGAAFEEFTAVRWLSLVVLALGALWIAVARYAGNEFRRMTEGARGAERSTSRQRHDTLQG